MENKHPRNMVFQDCEKDQDDKYPTDDVKTPNTDIRAECLNVCLLLHTFKV